MTNALGALAIVLLIGMVAARILVLKRRGIAAAQFGKTNKTDFLIPPFALFYVYLILASALHWPTIVRNEVESVGAVAWLGVALCALGLSLMIWTLASFGQSFRVGIDTEEPGRLVTSGTFALSRNPIYVAFGLVLLGELLILPHWIMLLYLLAGFALFHRQVTREEAYLQSHYGDEYRAYRERVPRYL